MSKATPLLSLIKSLTPNEKGYLKKYCFNKEGALNKLLVSCLAKAENLISKQEDFLAIEIALKQQFNKHKTYTYSIVKSQLIETITNALLEYNSKGDAEFKVMKLLGKIKMLMKRNNKALAFDFLQKAKKIAAENGYTYLINRCELVAVQLAADDQVIGRQLDEKIELLNKSNDALYYSSRLSSLNISCWNLRQTLTTFKSSKNELGLKKEKEQLVKKLVAIPVETLTPMERIKYYQVKRQIYFLPVTAINECCACGEEALLIFNSNKQLKTSTPNIYIGVATIYLNDIIYAKNWLKYKGALATVQRALEDYKQKMSRGPDRHYNLIYLQLLFCKEKNDYQQLEVISKDFKGNVKKSKPHWYWQWAINFSLAHSYFVLRNYSKALDYLLQSKTNNINLAVNSAISTKVLEIVLHYELKNYEVLPYLIRSFYRFLKSKNQLFSIEKELIYIFKSLAKVKNDKAFKEMLKSQLVKLRFLENEDENQPILSEFDFVAYIAAIVTGVNYREVYANKLRSYEIPK